MYFIVSHEMMVWKTVLRLKYHKRLGLEDDLYTPPVRGKTISKKAAREGFQDILVQKHSSHHCPKQKDIHSHNRQNCMAPYFSMCVLRNGLAIKTRGSKWLFLSKMPVLYFDLGKLVQSTSKPFYTLFTYVRGGSTNFWENW